MPCVKPIEVGIRRKSLYSKRGTRDLVIVSCGSCLGCRQEQSRQWTIRLMHESRMHLRNLFVTLTYEKLPESGGLRPKDFTRFVKGLRQERERDAHSRELGIKRFSFFGCGEYGETTGRGHYHALLFGIDLCDIGGRFDRMGREYQWSKTLDDVWGRGKTEIGSVTDASIAYTAGYVRKKVKAKMRVRANPITGELLAPEFARMSLRPAIGLDWIKRWWRDVYPRDSVQFNGRPNKPPRYYDKWMDRPNEKGGTAERREIMETVRQQRMDESSELSQYSRNAAELTLKSRINLFSRRAAI